MLRLLIGVSFLYLLYRLLKGPKRPKGSKGHHGAPRPSHNDAPGEDLVEDPHCHTYIPVSSAYRESVGGKTLYFCSQSCLEQYKGAHRNDEAQRRKEAGS